MSTDNFLLRLPSALIDRLMSVVYVIVGFVGLFMAGRKQKKQSG